MIQWVATVTPASAQEDHELLNGTGLLGPDFDALQRAPLGFSAHTSPLSSYCVGPSFVRALSAHPSCVYQAPTVGCIPVTGNPDAHHRRQMTPAMALCFLGSHCG